MATYKTIGTYLNLLVNDLAAYLQRELDKAGYPEIRPSHSWFFRYIHEEGSRITALANYAGITKQSMSALVHQMEEWGYLEREVDYTDKRGVLFRLTQKGQLLQQTGRGISYAFEKRWEKKLGIAGYNKFRDSIAKLCEEDK